MTDFFLWLQKRFDERPNAPSEESLRELAEVSEQTVRRYFARPKGLRPSAIAAEMERLANHLKAAAQSAEKLGEQGMALIVIASSANREIDAPDFTSHVLYLETMARWTERASETAKGLNISARDHKGGRTPDQRLRDVIIALMTRYQELLGLRITHTIDPQSGLAIGDVSLFVKESLRLFAPEGAYFEPRLIDDLIGKNLGARDLEFFEPPSTLFE